MTETVLKTRLELIIISRKFAIGLDYLNVVRLLEIIFGFHSNHMDSAFNPMHEVVDYSVCWSCRR